MASRAAFFFHPHGLYRSIIHDGDSAFNTIHHAYNIAKYVLTCNL